MTKTINPDHLLQLTAPAPTDADLVQRLSEISREIKDQPHVIVTRNDLIVHHWYNPKLDQLECRIDIKMDGYTHFIYGSVSRFDYGNVASKIWQRTKRNPVSLEHERYLTFMGALVLPAIDSEIARLEESDNAM